MSVVAQIREILEAERDFKLTDKITDDDHLIERGVVDSFGMISLVVLLEKKFTIKVNPEDVTQDDFRSIGAIARYVEGKLGAGNRG